MCLLRKKDGCYLRLIIAFARLYMKDMVFAIRFLIKEARDAMAVATEILCDGVLHGDQSIDLIVLCLKIL